MENKYYLLTLEKENIKGIYNKVINNETPAEYLCYQRKIMNERVILIFALEISKEEYDRLDFWL